MKKLLFGFCFFLSHVYGQQMIVSGSPIYNFHLFEKGFVGKIWAISKLWYDKRECTSWDTLIYISSKDKLFYDFDTSKLNLTDMFEGIRFDYNRSSKNFIDKSGKNAMLFDTVYKYEKDNFVETILFYRLNNFFVHRQNKNTDSICTYMTRLFDKEKRLQRITYYHNKNKCEATENITTYLSRIRFSEMYEFTYVLKGGIKKIASLNYYRIDEKTGKKMLYASNNYLYGKNNMLCKIFFEQFNGMTRIKGETIFKYCPSK